MQNGRVGVDLVDLHRAGFQTGFVKKVIEFHQLQGFHHVPRLFDLGLGGLGLQQQADELPVHRFDTIFKAVLHVRRNRHQVPSQGL